MEAHTLGATLKSIKQKNIKKPSKEVKQISSKNVTKYQAKSLNKISSKKGAPEIFRKDVMYIMV